MRRQGSGGGGGVSTPVGASAAEPVGGGAAVFVLYGAAGFVGCGGVGVAAGAALDDGVGSGVVVTGAGRCGCGVGAGVATVVGAGAGGVTGRGTVVVVVVVVRVAVRAGGGGVVAGAASAGARGIVVIGTAPVASGLGFGAVAQLTCAGFGMPSPIASGARATRSRAGSSFASGGACVGPGAFDSPSGNSSGSDGGRTYVVHAETSRSAQTRKGGMPSGGCERHAACFGTFRS
jgi:hypothetical protein